MLAFKKNIYFCRVQNPTVGYPQTYLDEEYGGPSPFNFIETALLNSQHLLRELEEENLQAHAPPLDILFPQASRFADLTVLHHLSRQLTQGFTDCRNWYAMNCYHQCYLYDCLLEVVEDYSYNSEEERKTIFPELSGREMDFNQFLNEYFFNTVFLMAAERFNTLTADERKQLGRPPMALKDISIPGLARGEEDPTLSKVINRIPPSPDEIPVIPLPKDPYSP
ncbi:MAG: hypothetical protein GWM98_13615 [Nitrospinaceae bacterium]|nr:hypothetical protein [Nitrospinaceae bacterium]NIR55317.1 hypothetical protein [Nitrospinaceae bacterium]NIS85756.1 hypothetical protein [Nitrospinaceae bacterium]NIT82606.1 hypothetical protein [Nitrospinaceae bacterium]NIU44811.1 hypothetical protein [Nitrospinaceae bacterium]